MNIQGKELGAGGTHPNLAGGWKLDAKDAPLWHMISGLSSSLSSKKHTYFPSMLKGHLSPAIGNQQKTGPWKVPSHTWAFSGCRNGLPGVILSLLALIGRLVLPVKGLHLFCRARICLHVKNVSLHFLKKKKCLGSITLVRQNLLIFGQGGARHHFGCASWICLFKLFITYSS